MKTVIDRASSRGYFNHGWLKTHHTFSFADYHNPNRVHFGALRVLNDDIVAPSEGFGTHPHQNMEVVSIPLQGHLRHGDSVQNTQTITVGDIQVMSAGTGIFHSEYNGSSTEPVSFLQIWIIPREQDTPPAYANYDIRGLMKPNELSLILSPDGQTPASIRQDAWFSLGELDKGVKTGYKLHGQGHGVYVFLIEGRISVAGQKLERRDGLGIWDVTDIEIEALENAKILLMEVPMF